MEEEEAAVGAAAGAAVEAAGLALRPGHRYPHPGQRHTGQRVPRGGQRAHGVSGVLPRGEKPR